MTPAKLRWGLLLVTAGVMLLLNNAGVVDWDYWLELAWWWPLLLIAIGFEKIFLRTKMQFLSYLSPVFIVLFMIYVAVDVGPSRFRHYSFFTAHDWQIDMDESVQRVKAVISHGRSDLTIDRTGTYLASARFDRFSRKPRIDSDVSNGLASVDINTGGSMPSAIIINAGDFDNDWKVRFTDEAPVELRCSGNEADVNLYLVNIQVEKLEIENDDGDIYIKIGDKSPQVDIKVEGYDAGLRVNVPSEAGVKVFGEAYSDYLEKIGYMKMEDYYVTEGFDSTSIHITLRLDEDLRHLSLTNY